MVEITIVPGAPALILQGKKKHLVITDLHLGFEGSLGANEIFVGKNTTLDETTSYVVKLLDQTRPDALVLLGDIKSGISSISGSEWNDVPKFFDKINKKTDTIVVPGNHDANLQRLVPSETTLTGPIGLIIEDALLTHGHTMPTENFAHVNHIIMGHLHPVFFQKDSVLNGSRVWVSIRAKKQNIFSSQRGLIEITIVPSFNKYFYATHKRRHKKSISPIIDKITVESARIVTLDGSLIGDESAIRSVI